MFKAIKAKKQKQTRIPSRPLNKLSYEYLLFLSSPLYLSLEHTYYICEYVRHERYLDLYEQYGLRHKEILKKIDDENEEIRKGLYCLLQDELFDIDLSDEFMRKLENDSYYSFQILLRRADENFIEEHEEHLMDDLKSYLTGGAKETIMMIEEKRRERRKEIEDNC